ncbi:MAG: GNAT family N-acetyltransferase [Candidatus Hadarchaeum sp.]
MTTTRAHPHPKVHRSDGLQPIRAPRDLHQIAELVELCFGPYLDPGGRAAIREMKAVAQLGLLLWPLAWLAPTSLGLEGYVWREQGRVVGNVNLYQAGQHPYLGRGSLIANVAVHPDYRRRGIASALMDAALQLARRQRSRWIALQVEAENLPALSLYDRLGFERFETVAQWQGSIYPSAWVDATWPIRRRQPADLRAEVALIFERARCGAMIWGRPIERDDLAQNLWGLLMDTQGRWVLPDLAGTDRLYGSLWVEAIGWQHARIELFIDPALTSPEGRQALLLHALNMPSLQGRAVNLETTAADDPVEQILKQAGFSRKRVLVQMRINLT